MNNQVKVKITGKNPHTFLQELIITKVNIYELEKEKNILKIRIDYSDYEKIKDKKTTYKIEIMNYYGLLKMKYILKKYFIFIMIVLLGIGINYFLSTRIWQVEIVSSNQKLITILKKNLKELKVTPYAKKISYQEKEKIKKKILEQEKDIIEWLEIEEQGSKYIVKVEERKKNIPQKQCVARDIVAKKNAILIETKAETGEIIKKKNDYIAKGETIISGWIHNKETVVSKKCATGIVYGEVWYKTKVIVPKEKMITSKTEKKKKGISVFFLKNEYDLFRKFRNYEKKEYNIIEDKVIPLKLSLVEYQEIISKKHTYSSKEIDKIAITKSTKKIKENLKKDEEIIQKKVLKKTTINSKIEVEVFFKVKENITDYKDISKIEIENMNQEKE